MNKYDFPRPPKKKGYVQVNSGIPMSRAFLAALGEFCERQTANSGVKVSRATAIQTGMEQRYPEIKTRRLQLEEERHEKKYIDGIKR